MIETLRAELIEEQLVRFLCLCRFGERVWQAVEALEESVSEAYWHDVSASWARQSEQELQYAVTKLLEAKRGLTALQLVHLDLKNIESDQLYGILQAISTSLEADRNATSMDRHSIEEIFKLLNSRGSVSRGKMANLEFSALIGVAARIHHEMHRTMVAVSDTVPVVMAVPANPGVYRTA